MDTASPLGFGKAHVCCCLMLCGALVTMTAHTTQGIPVLQRITPTAKLPYRPSTPMFPYRKSFRSWAKKQHEDLWVDAPSGDGPTEQWDSRHASKTVSLPKTTVNEYATRSPTPEEIFSSQPEPFPSIIDTEVDSPEAFSDEVLSRSSAIFEGPSSLLNTLIFRPSISEGSVDLSPSYDVSSVAFSASYDLSASWREFQEPESYFAMSSRRAMSDIPNEVYAIITAISATHIYRDDSLTTDPSSLVSDDSFNHWLISSSMERIPDFESTTHLSYLPSYTTNVSVHLQTSYNAEQTHFSDYNQSVWQENPYSSITSSHTLFTDVLPQNVSDSFIESALLSDASIIDIDNGYPETFVAATFLHWSPFTTPIDTHTSSISGEKYYFSDMSVDSSFSDSVLFINPSPIIPIFTTYNTFILNTVETTVTIIDNKETPYTFILPTLTVSGTSYNKTHDNLSNLLHDFTIGSSYKELEYESSSTFSSFDTESTLFLKSRKNATFLNTQFPDTPTTFVSYTDQTTVFPVTEIHTSQQNKQEPLFMTSSYHPQSSFITFDKFNEILTSSKIFYSNHTLPETEVKELSSKTIILRTTDSQILSTEHNTNQTEFNMISIESTKVEIVSSQKPEYQTKISLQGSSMLIQENSTSDGIRGYTEIFPSVKTSFDILDEKNISTYAWRPTESLSNEIIYNTPEWENDIVSSRQSLKDKDTLGINMQSLPNIATTLLAPSLSNDEYLETSTHHVTYRSLTETLNFEISEYETTDEIYTNYNGAFHKSFESSSSSLELQTLSYISSILSTGEGIMILPSLSQVFQETSTITVKPILMDSGVSINTDSTILFDYPMSDKYITEPTTTIIRTSYQGDFFPIAPTTQISKSDFENLSESLWNDSSSKYVQELSSLQIQMTQSLEMSTGADYTTLIPELSSSSITFKTSTDYPITSTTILDDYSHNLSKFDNYFLESSNLSSKSLEEHPLVQSPAINSSSKELYNRSMEYNTLLDSKKFESSFERFTTNGEQTPIIYSSVEFLISSFDTTSEETHFEFRDRTEVLDTAEIGTTFTYASPDYKTYISNGDISSDFFASITPSLSSYSISSCVPFDTLNSEVSPEYTSHSIYSIPKILPHSVIIKSHSEIDNKMSASLSTLNVEAIHSSLVDTTSTSVETQKQVNESLYTAFDNISIISENREISRSKIDAMDLSMFTQLLSLTPSMYRTENLQQEHSTRMKEPRSLESYHPMNEVSNAFEIPSSLVSELDDTEESVYSETDIYDSFTTPVFSHYDASTATQGFLKTLSSSEETESIHLKSTVSELLTVPLKTPTLSNGKEYIPVESDYPHTRQYSFEILVSHSFYDSVRHLHETSRPINGKEPENEYSDYQEQTSTLFPASLLSSSFVDLESLKSQSITFISVPVPEVDESKTINWDSSKPSLYFSASELTPSYDTTVLFESHSTANYTKVDLLSLESVYPKPKITISSQFVSLSLPKTTDPQSIESDHPMPMISSSFRTVSPSHAKAIDPLSIESDHPMQRISSSFQTVSLSHTKAIDPPKIESDHPIPKISSSFHTVSPSHSKALDPFSIESDHPIRRISSSFQTLSPSHTKAIDSLSLESDHPIPKISSSFLTVSPSHTKVLDPLSIESDHPIRRISTSFQTLSPSHTKAIDPLSIESDHHIPKTSSSFQTVSPSHTKAIDPFSIESDHPKPKITITFQTPFTTHHTSFLSMKPQFELTSTLSHKLQPTSAKMSTLKTFSQTFSSVDLRPTWFDKDNTTPDETILIPISSYLNINHTINSSNGETSRTNEKSQEDETLSTSGEGTSPTDRTFLFKDNHYWVLTVLEAPVKGQLPENFSHTMEIRLANAYSEAFRIRAIRNNDTKGGKEMIIVKILSLTDDLLLRQLDIVYVVERGGSLVPASVAAEYLSSLRFEQLREFLGHHVIVKARPYQPRDNEGGREVVSPLPVLAIVGGVLGGLLFLLCCCCVYCRCCRPKQPPSSPESSTSGSLQRSLSKYGQHNRKHLFREMTHQLTSEMSAQLKHGGSSAADAYLAEKTAARSLPTLPREGTEDADTARKMLKILENKDASTSPVAGKSSRGGDLENDTSSSEKMKRTPKPKRRRKIKDSHEQQATDSKSVHPMEISQPESPPPTPPPKGDVSILIAESRQSYDSGTSSRHASTESSTLSEKGATETESEGSNIELLPPTQDQIDRHTEESPAAVETQLHLSRVRQRIAELLDDAFALAGGRKLYGSLRSKKIEPTADILPRFGSFRSKSAIGGDYTFRHPRAGLVERRPLTEGGQRLLGVITDEGQLLTHPAPKLVWDHEEGTIEGPIVHEVIEARNLNLFPFHSPGSQHMPALPSSSTSLPVLDHGPGSPHSEAALAASLREAASELQIARSTRMNPAVVEQYDEIDVVGALRSGEPVEAIVRAIKEELQRFSGSLPGASDGESHA